MKLKTKQVIAREFLLFICVIVIGLLAYLSTSTYNYILQRDVKNLDKKISDSLTLIATLRSTYEIKENKKTWFFNEGIKEYELNKQPDMNNKEDWWNLFDGIVLSDSLKYRWEHKWEKFQIEWMNKIGFKTPEQFIKFIGTNRITEIDLSKKNQAQAIEENTEKLTPLE